jgi:hypothetical protein
MWGRCVGAVLAVTMTAVAVTPAALSSSLAQVSVPAAPPTTLPPAPLPARTAPSLPALPPGPGLPAPDVPVPSLPVPSLADTGVPVPRLPSPQLDSPSPGALGSPGATRTDARAATGAGGGDGAGLGAGPSASGAEGGAGRRLAGRAARRPRDPGVLGTRYRSRRTLARALRGCIGRLPRRQRALVILRYGLAGARARPAAAVARALDVSIQDFVVIRRRALRGLVRAARSSSCEDRGTAGTPVLAAVGGVAFPVQLAAFETNAGERGPARAGGDVLGGRSSGRVEQPIPAAVRPPLEPEQPGGGVSLPVVVVVGLMLALLGWVAYRRARAAAERRRAYRGYFP